MKKQFLGNVYLFIAVFIWGSTFIAQSVGMDTIGPLTFLTARCALAVLFLIPMIALTEARDIKNYISKWLNKKLWLSGALCGLSLFVASSLQQIAIVDTDAGKAGFLTALYVVLVPVLGIFWGKKPTVNVVISILLSVVGLYLISCVGAAAIRLSDILLLLSALAFAVQITLVDRLGGGLDSMRLNCIQCLVTGILTCLCMFLWEEPKMEAIFQCWLPLGYAGILSMGIAYSMQMMGQRWIEPNTAAIIMSLESVVAVLCGWLLLGENMSVWELSGCLLLFVAVILSQLSPIKKRRTV